jgi:hypothetical protein
VALHYMSEHKSPLHTAQAHPPTTAQGHPPTTDLTVGFTKEILRAGNGQKPQRGQKVTVRSIFHWNHRFIHSSIHAKTVSAWALGVIYSRLFCTTHLDLLLLLY